MPLGSHETNELVNPGHHGSTYEKEMAKFVLKRIFFQNFPEFKFTRERTELGKFDDLVYVYKDHQKSFCQLFQLKHIDDDRKLITYNDLTRTNESYFFLPKYFESFLQISETLKKPNDMDGAELERLFICTNIEFDVHLGPISKRLEANCDIFQGSGSLYKLEIDDKEKKKIFSESYLPESERLANELVSFIMKGNPINISAMKKDGVPSLMVTYHVTLAEKVFDVPNKMFYPDFISSPQLPDSGLDHFRTVLLKRLEEFYQIYGSLSDNELKKYFKKKAEKVMGNIKKYKEKTSMEEFLSEVRLELVSGFGQRNPSDKVRYFRKETLCTAEVDRNIDEFLKVLTFAVDLSNNRSLLQNEINNYPFYTRFSEKVDDWYNHGFYYPDPTDESKKMRNWITKEQIKHDASETLIGVQGHYIKLGHIIDDMTLLDPLTLMQFYVGIELNVGAKEILENSEVFCLERILQRELKVLSSDVFQGSNTDIFLFSLSEDDDLKFLNNIVPDTRPFKELECFRTSHRFYILEKDFGMRHWKNFVEYKARTLFNPANIHWIKVTQKKLFLYRSFGSKSNIEAFIKENDFKCEYVKETNIPYDGRLILIEAEPGMGKSFLINNTVKKKLVESYEPNEIPTWVMKIILRDHIDRLAESKELTAIDEVIKFLSKCENLTDNISQMILKYFIEKGHSVFIGLDGLDEVRDVKLQTKILDMVQCLKEFPGVEVWITTRQHLTKDVEKTLEVDSWSLKEVDKKQQIDIMTECWKLNPNVSKEENLVMHAERLIEIFRFGNEIENLSKTEEELFVEAVILGTVFINYPILEESDSITDYLNNGKLYLENIKKFEELIKNKESFHNPLRNLHLFGRIRPFPLRIISSRETRNDPKMLLGIPLQTFMLASVYPPKRDDEVQAITEQLSLALLFKEFIERKFKIFIEEKEKLHWEKSLKYAIPQIYTNHEEFAIHRGGLLSPDEIRFLSKVESSAELESLLQSIEDTGIILKTKGAMQFLHRSFAEYLIAKRLAQKSKKAKAKNHLRDLEQIKEILLQQDRKNILYFYDMIVSEENKIHKSILNDDEDLLKKISDKDVKTRDCLGRNSLYYAAKYDKWKSLVPLTFEKFSKGEKSQVANENNLCYYRSNYYRHRHFNLDLKITSVLRKFQAIWQALSEPFLNFYSLPIIFDFFVREPKSKNLIGREIDWLHDRENEYPTFWFNSWINFCIDTPPNVCLSKFLVHAQIFFESIQSDLEIQENNICDSESQDNFFMILDLILRSFLKSIGSSLSCFLDERNTISSLCNDLYLCQFFSERKMVLLDALSTLLSNKYCLHNNDLIDYVVEKNVISILISMNFNDKLISTSLHLKIACIDKDAALISKYIAEFQGSDIKKYSSLFGCELLLYLKYGCKDPDLIKKGLEILNVKEF